MLQVDDDRSNLMLSSSYKYHLTVQILTMLLSSSGTGRTMEICSKGVLRDWHSDQAEGSHQKYCDCHCVFGLLIRLTFSASPSSSSCLHHYLRIWSGHRTDVPGAPKVDDIVNGAGHCECGARLCHAPNSVPHALSNKIMLACGSGTCGSEGWYKKKTFTTLSLPIPPQLGIWSGF